MNSKFALLLAAAIGHPLFAATGPLHVQVPSSQSIQESAASSLFVEETAKRLPAAFAATLGRGRVSSASCSGDVVVLASRSAAASLLPSELHSRWVKQQEMLHPTAQAEAFSIVSLRWGCRQIVVVAGNDARGELFGAGWLLRHMNFSNTGDLLPQHLHLFQAPDKPVRGHQLGYRFKNNTYDAWSLARFEQGIRDLAIFGTNTIQLIAPQSDDAATSPLYPAPALDTLLGISAILERYGLDCDLYYPELRKDYTDPSQVAAELKDFEALVRAMPRLDALYIPGGDPGHTPPAPLFGLVAKEAMILRRYHPHATVWISGQGFDRERYEEFYSLLNEQPAWLTGVFFGPQSRDSFFVQRRRIPARYAMQFYPDIAHTMHAQFPVPQWDPIFALTEGREPICPRPQAFAEIYRHFEALHSGFVTYSEGINDDVNKFFWSELGWSSKTSVHDILGEYVSLFLHRSSVEKETAVQAIGGLEEDWNGPLIANEHIPATRKLFQSLEDSSTPSQTKANPAWEMLLYRGIYDDYVQRKLRRERSAESLALAALDQTSDLPAQRIDAARKALAQTTPDAIERSEHDRLFELAGELFHDAGLQLSVKLYGASNWERGANLDRVDTALTETAWLNSAMDAALKLPEDARRNAALHEIVHWASPAPGTLYDDLGDPTAEPHLLRQASWQSDPEMYGTSIDGIADQTLDDGWRLSWLDYAETLYETPLELRYTGVDKNRSYHVRITYAGEGYALPLRLTANGTTEIHPARLRKSNPETVEFPIPAEATAHGSLNLQWTGPAGSGGSGRGRQVAEVWLIPQ